MIDMIDAIPQDASRLPMRFARTACGDGGTDVRATVYCPARRRSMDLADCLECERCLDVLADASGAHLVCRPRGGGTGAPPPDAGAFPAADAGGPPAHDPQRTPVRDLMRADLWCVLADVAAPRVRELVADAGPAGLPVVDAGGRPIGVVTGRDLARDAAAGAEPAVTAAALMTPEPVTVREDVSVARAAAVMAAAGVHGLPVVCARRQVVGAVSCADLIGWIAGSAR